MSTTHTPRFPKPDFRLSEVSVGSFTTFKPMLWKIKVAYNEFEKLAISTKRWSVELFENFLTNFTLTGKTMQELL